MTRHVLVGLGVASTSAIEAIRSVEARDEITVIGDDPHGYYSRPGLAYYLTGELNADQLFAYPPEIWRSLNVRVLRGQVTRVLPAEKLVEVDGGKQRIAYDKLLLATGSTALCLTIPGAGLEGVVKLDHMDDARRILNLARRAKAAVVVGGGITALEIVEGLVKHKVKVHYLLRGERYWGNVLDEFESHVVEERLRSEGVNIHFNSELAEVIGKSGKVEAVRLASGEVIHCALVVAAIGITPRTELARASGLNVERGILADTSLRTSLPDIFAAGDAAQVLEPESGRYVLDSLWNPARLQGWHAGLNMAGKVSEYQKSTSFNVTRLAELTVTIIGAVGGGRDDDLVNIAHGDSETWRDVPDAIIAQSGFEVNRVRLMVGVNHILGAVVMGDQTLSIPLQRIITDKMDIATIRARLLARNAPLGEILFSYWKSFA